MIRVNGQERIRLEIVQLTGNQLQEAIQLDEYAFQFKADDDQREKELEKLKKFYKIYGIYEGQELAAKVELISFDIHLGDKRLKMGGIAGVATYPEFRRKGYIKELLEHVLVEMRKGDYSVSMLHPFFVSFYRKFGWEILSNQLKMSMKKTDLFRNEPVGGKIKRFDQHSHPDDLEQVYNQFAGKYYGMVVRDRDIWQSFVYGHDNDWITAVYYNEENQPTGYILYKVNHSKMVVKEFASLDREARSGLWNFICQHDSMIDELEMTTPEDEPVFFTLKDPRVKSELSPYGMVRIVDVASFFNQYPFQWEHVDAKVVLHIADSTAPWNDQTIVFKDQEIIMVNEEEVDSYRDQGVELTINALSTVLFGYKGPWELYEINQISGSETDIQAFDKLLPHEQPFLYNFF